MKKLVLLIMVLLLSGCQKQSTTSIYDEMIQTIKEENTYKTESSYFSTTYYITEIEDDKYRYDIIIDTPTVDMRYIRAIAITNDEDSSIFPSIGYNEGDTYHMAPDIVDKTNHYFKGIQLSGDTYLSDGEIKLYVEFTYNNELVKEYILIDGETQNET